MDALPTWLRGHNNTSGGDTMGAWTLVKAWLRIREGFVNGKYDGGRPGRHAQQMC